MLDEPQQNRETRVQMQHNYVCFEQEKLKLRPVHLAVWGYAEWRCDHGLTWPKLDTVAADLARNSSDVSRAFAELLAIGVMSTRQAGSSIVLCLGDGRETLPPRVQAS